MDFIKNYFEQHGNIIIEKLKNNGFSTEQAKQFLPEAIIAVIHSIRSSGARQMVTELLSGEPSQLISSINIHALASELRIDPELATAGLEAISPALAQAFLHRNGNVMHRANSLSNGSATGNFISATNKLFFH